MQQKIALIRERQEGLETERYTDYFLTENTENIEQKLREAVQEFALTPKGIEAIRTSMEDFNWGDAAMYIPEEILEKHGFKRIEENIIEIIVDQDELLIPSAYWDLEEA